MTDAASPTPPALDPKRIRQAIKAGDEAGLRVAAAVAVDITDHLKLLRILVRQDGETVAPGLAAEVFGRAFAIPPVDDDHDAVLFRLSRTLRPQALAAARQAYATGHRRAIVARLALEAAAQRSDADAAAIGADLLATRPLTHHHITAAKQLLVLGLRAPVRDWIATVETSNDLADAGPKVVDGFRDLVAHSPRGVDMDDVVIIHRQPGARRVVFAFSGLSNKFGIELERLIEWMAPLDAHLVMLKDPELLLYLKGIAAIGPDLRSTAEGLQSIARELGAEEILCMGSSAGGFAAIRYGVLMNASRIVAFGALTILTAERTERRADGRAPGLAERLLTEVRSELGDCREWLQARTPPIPVDLYYGDEMPNDRFQAHNIEGVPGVTLHPLSTLDGHAVTRALDRSGEMPAILEAFVEGRPLPDVA